MDTNMIKRISLITAGGILGGIVGYFLGGLIVNQLIRRSEELEWKKEDETLHGHVSIREIGEEEVQTLIKDHKALDYTKFAKGELTELVKPYTSSIAEESKKSDAKSDKIMIINSEEYENNRSHNKEPITYYENDTTFANLQEDIIDDPVSIFGPNIHLHFGEESEDPDIVYVRNENNGVDYEISRVHNSYSVIVMGMPEEAPKETKAKRRRNVRKVTAHDDEDKEDESEN